MIVVLPAYEETDIEVALHALNECKAPTQQVLIIVLVNEPTDAAQNTQTLNKKTLETIRSFPCKFDLKAAYIQLPPKKAGVGLARKVGMDEAVRIFNRNGHDGIIICYDADCRCDRNYLIEIEKAYDGTSTQAGIVFFEHQLNLSHHEAILHYELYLRYYINALRFAGFPYAHQTLGSCITVRSSCYEKVGGMNSRQAGEDFYFLNKTIPHGNFKEINTTTVRPSDRVSHRVPFGTGRAVQQILESDETYAVYHPNTFEDLKLFFQHIDGFWEAQDWQIPRSMESFLGENWKSTIAELKAQVSTKDNFKKRFFHWFDAFKILKYVHHNRLYFYQDVVLEEAIEWLWSYTLHIKGSLESQLIQLRYFDRNY